MHDFLAEPFKGFEDKVAIYFLVKAPIGRTHHSAATSRPQKPTTDHSIVLYDLILGRFEMNMDAFSYTSEFSLIMTPVYG